MIYRRRLGGGLRPLAYRFARLRRAIKSRSVTGNRDSVTGQHRGTATFLPLAVAGPKLDRPRFSKVFGTELQMFRGHRKPVVDTSRQIRSQYSTPEPARARRTATQTLVLTRVDVLKGGARV
eukprot:3810450-Rhodomonas_salina.4